MQAKKAVEESIAEHRRTNQFMTHPVWVESSGQASVSEAFTSAFPSLKTMLA